MSNWLRGDIVQFDISDPAHPKVAGRVWVGGLVHKDSPLKVGRGQGSGWEPFMVNGLVRSQRA